MGERLGGRPDAESEVKDCLIYGGGNVRNIGWN